MKTRFGVFLCRVIATILLGIPCVFSHATAGLIAIEPAAGNTLTVTAAGAGTTKGALLPEALLLGYNEEGSPEVTSIGQGMQVVRKMRAGEMSCVVTETYMPTKDSIRWETTIVSDNSKPGTTPLVFRLKYPATADTRFWTSWLEGAASNGARPLSSNPLTAPGSARHIISIWQDPLELAPLISASWPLGGIVNSRDMCIPIATLVEPQADTGISFVASPDQPLLKLTLNTQPDGTVQFQLGWMRLGDNRTIKFAADIVSHEADWRGGLRWMVNRYPEFFNPPNPKADEVAGNASYSHRRGKFTEEEVTRLNKMAYHVNWAATFDWPYFGMYLPPMPNADATWETSGHNANGARDPKLVVQMSYRKMNDECRYLKENGFYQLNYFNVTEFGSQIGKPEDVKKDLPKDEIWKDATTELYTQFPNAVMKTDKNAPISSWSGSIAVDAADPAFHAHLLEMAQRHIDNLPDAAGICIDRMDWIGRINYGADDGIGWYNRPGRSMVLSWNGILADLGKLMHSHGKVIFGNPSWIHRLDVVRELDGFYDEFGADGFFLNGSSMLALRKPAIMWSGSSEELKPDKVDGYFQELLYMGAFTTVPFEGNDHCLQPGPNTDQIFFDYGPLSDALRGKKWVLEPHCVAVDGGAAKVNLFSVPGGWSMPVVFGSQDGTVKVSIRNVPGITPNLKMEAIQPGVEAPQPVSATVKGDALQLEVPLHRGCAMVRIFAS